VLAFFTVNTALNKFFGADQVATVLSDIWLYVSIAIALAFVGWGVAQWIRRKSFLAVDKRILALGCLYVAVALFYVMFQVVVVNYRPQLQNGALEVSFPSTHVLVTVAVAVSAMSALKHRVDDHHRILFCNLLHFVCACNGCSPFVEWRSLVHRRHWRSAFGLCPCLLLLLRRSWHQKQKAVEFNKKIQANACVVSLTENQ